MKTMQMNQAEIQFTPPAPRRGAKGGRWFATGLLLLAALLVWPANIQARDKDNGGKRGVDTMTVNLYVGGGTERVLTLDPTDPAYLSNLVFTVTGVFYEIVASDPVTRMGGVADRIAARRPDLVAVQEASLIRNQSPGDLVEGGT